MKCVGMPIWPSRVKTCSEMRLLSTPLPLIVPFFLRVERGRIVLEILDHRAGFGALIKDLCLAFVDLAAAGHTRSCLVKNTAPRQTRIEWISGCRGCFTRRLNAKRFTVQ
jgi:hypothetical protein